jgi:glycosyltransferase involved in cell wall biosynthesis
MRIGIDVRYLSHGLMGGIHTYLVNLLPTLISLTGEHEIYLYVDTKRPFELQSLPDYVTVRFLPYRSPLSSIYNDLFMRRQMAQDDLDLVHFTANYGFGPASARTVITLHDEINIMPLFEIIRGHPKNLRTIGMMTYLHYCTRAALRRADTVITVSEYSKRQIARYSSLDARKIAPVPHACPRDIKRIENADELADVRRRLHLTRPFVLADAFKNPDVLVRAWRLLPKELQEKYELIFFSRSANVRSIVNEAVTAGFVRLLVRPVRRDLDALYSMADVFVFPSWIEGFGIPLLEAMTCGAPVIASDRGAIPEVVGDAALLMDAEDDKTLADHLKRLLGQPGEREKLRERGFARASQFSWPRIGREVLDIYQRTFAMQKERYQTIVALDPK